jgi:peptidoglycan hydrolase-like protein with peptidoglycan-binding domain
MTRSPVHLTLVLAVLVVAAPSLFAETPAKPPSPPATADGTLAAQKAQFLALAPPIRKAVQEALVWLGLYNGANDGDFGQRTRDSIVAWQKSQKALADGVLTTSQVEALLAAGQKARAGAGFQALDDPKTGARIGAPTKLIAAKGGPRLDFASDASGDLAALYTALSAETQNRKVAYKAMKPNAFFVVSGQEGATKFYSRFDKNSSADPPIRGFTFSYPAARAGEFDRVAIAVANAFDPFPARASATANGGETPLPPPRPPTPPARPVTALPAPTPAPAATALIIGPGRALTALKPDDCPGASLGGKPARFERTDAASGLSILAGDFAAKGEPPRLGAPGGDLVVLSADGERIAANAATAIGDAGRRTAVASLEKSASGSPAFDRNGGLAGLIAPVADEPRRVAGVPLATPHAMIEAEAIGGFLGGGVLMPAEPQPLTAGAIAEREKGSVVGVLCSK